MQNARGDASSRPDSTGALGMPPLTPYNSFMPDRFRRSDLVALVILTLAVLAVYARVLLTPLIPASGDFLAYFTPYWQQLNQALRAGHLPLWNDFIYAGAPFQANPQTEVFYPLRWPLIFLSAEKGILITDALHVWLAGVFGYFLIKKLLGAKKTRGATLPALAGALIIALNGWVTGLLLHPNQISAYPWLIAAILLWEKRPRPGQWPRRDRPMRRWGVMMTLVWAMAFLAGHTQSFYNAAVIFGLWVLGDVVWRGWEERRKSVVSEQFAVSSKQFSVSSKQFAVESNRLAFLRTFLSDAWPVALATLVIAGVVAAAQLLPTLELSGLSFRQGGMAFRDHAALSLPPWRLGFTLLPHYARDLGMALGTEAYGEWLGYIGLTGLILALLGLRHPNRRMRFLGAFLTLAGLLLAFGAYDPLEYLLYRIVPGWDLFRVPARFLQAAVLGLALLAALGMDWISRQYAVSSEQYAVSSMQYAVSRRHERQRAEKDENGVSRTDCESALGSGCSEPDASSGGDLGNINRQTVWWRSRCGAVMVVAGILLAVLALLTRPNPATLAGWAAILAFFALLLWNKRKRSRSNTHYPIPTILYLIPLILFLELYFASYALPIQHPTAPQALRSWRTAPARIASELGPTPHGGACRTLSLSATTWDPGDLGDLQRIYGPYLDEKAFTDLVNATKAKEVVAPNLGVLFDIPSLDGFGGGVLPTARFVKAMSLFLPPESIVADGRLREQLHSIPDSRLLSLFNVCYVIADKNFDVWHDDIYYDLAFGETLDAAHPDLSVTDMPGFPASGVGVVSHLSDDAARLPRGTSVALAIITFYDNSTAELPLRAGMETAVGEDAARPFAQDDLPAVRWPHNAPGRDVIADLDIPANNLPARLSDRRIQSVDFHLLRDDVSLFIRGMAVYDRASGSHATPIVTRAPWQRIHSGDVKIYRNDAALPRAFAVARVQTVANLDEAVDAMKSPGFDPASTAILEENSAVLAPRGIPLSSPRLQISERRPERLRLHYEADGAALLIISEGWHPGWRAILDPDAADARDLPVFPADIFLRGVALPAGEHDLLMIFQPSSLRWGMIISLLALAGLAILWILPDGKD